MKALLVSLVVVGVASAAWCPKVTPGTPAQTIQELKPSDISLMLALGDSVTAGAVADGQVHEYRGGSWSIGGDEVYPVSDPNNGTGESIRKGDPVLTLPALFKIFARNGIKGASTGSHFVTGTELPHYWQDQLNAAVSGAEVQDLHDQLGYLMRQLWSGRYGDPDTTVHQTWKLLSIFIGGNNICRVCKDTEGKDSPDTYERLLDQALEEIHQNLPRTLVHIISLPHFTAEYALEEQVPWCRLVHHFGAECKCLFKDATDADRTAMDVATVGYNQALRRIRTKWAAKGLKDFAVVLNPFNEEVRIPEEKYMSKLDCFHPSLLGHQFFTLGSWNSLFLPFDSKPTTWQVNNTKVFCPDHDMLIPLN